MYVVFKSIIMHLYIHTFVGTKKKHKILNW
jgi:hypothetical protein